LAVRLEEGTAGTADEVESLITTTRAVGQVDVNVLGFAVAAAALVAEAPREACRLLAELEELPGVRGSSYYARHLQGMIRTALAAGDATLARALVGGIESRYPLEAHALCAARAQLAEHDGDFAGAAALHAEAAERWQEFGNVREHAYALLGYGRCLRRLKNPQAEAPLRAARQLFEAMGYKPALAEVDTLLGHVDGGAHGASGQKRPVGAKTTRAGQARRA
jgi:hypothetical protein